MRPWQVPSAEQELKVEYSQGHVRQGFLKRMLHLPSRQVHGCQEAVELRRVYCGEVPNLLWERLLLAVCSGNV
jgi:hypothetical protein